MPHDYDADDVHWLDQLISSYDSEHDWDADDDPTATMEMLHACGRLANLLRAVLPSPAKRGKR
jgi:hypothetical protein